MKRLGLALGSFLLGSMFVSVGAHAGQFAQSDIGGSVPYWVETAAVNDRGEVAWTQLDASTTFGVARYYSVDADLPLNPLPAESSSASWATDISQAGWVVGYASTDARLLDSRALVWTSESPGVFEQVELNDAFGIPMQQTMAKGVVQSASGHVVVGSARQKVARDVLPLPAVWNVTPDPNAPLTVTVEASRLGMPAAFAGGNGILVSVAEALPDGTQFACGNTSPSGGYTHATCWEIGSGNLEGRPGELIAPLQAKAPVTSLVNRVRTLPIGPNQEFETLVIGSYLDLDLRWSGWVYNLSTDELWTDDFGLAPNADSFAFDAAKVRYSDVTNPKAHGWMIGGYSATVGGGTLPSTTGPKSVPVAPLSAVVQRRLLHGVTETGATCRVSDEAEASVDPYYQVVALSSDDRYRLVRAGSQLKLLTNIAIDAAVALRVRDTRVRTTALQTAANAKESTATAHAYYQAEAAATAGEALLVLSNAPGCAPADGPGGLAACGGSSMSVANFDLAGTGAHMLRLSEPSAPGRLRSEKVPGTLSFTTRPFAQLLHRATSGDCTMSLVMETDAVVELNPEYDFDSPVRWFECHTDIPGYDTDVRFAYDHCGSCGNTVDDGLSCTTNWCDSSTATRSIDPNTCLISDACYANQQRKPESDFRNPCQSCQPTTSATLWTKKPTSSCCDAAGQPILDAWDQTGSGAGTDKNSGATPGAVWNGQTFTKSSFWNNWREINHQRRCENTLTRINGASFTPGVDEEDWYRARFEGGKNEKLLEPRVDLLASSSLVQDLEVCIFVECTEPNATTSLTDVWAPGGATTQTCSDFGGTNGCASRRPIGSPAHHAVGVCAATSASAQKARIELNYNCRVGNTDARKDANSHVRVRPIGMDDSQQCTSYNYSLRIGNDIEKRCDALGNACGIVNRSPVSSSCVDCCDSQ